MNTTRETANENLLRAVNFWAGFDDVAYDSGKSEDGGYPIDENRQKMFLGAIQNLFDLFAMNHLRMSDNDFMALMNFFDNLPIKTTGKKYGELEKRWDNAMEDFNESSNDPA